MKQNMSNLLVVGSVAYDSIVTPFGKANRTLGGSASYFSLASRFFTKASVIAVVGNDFKKNDITTLKKHADICGLSTAEGKTFHWSGKYSHDLNSRETLSTELGVFANFKPTLSPVQKNTKYIFLGNTHPKLQLEVLEQIKEPKFVGLDTMNYWMDTALTDLKKVLKKIDCLIINDSEARQLSNEHNLLKAAKKILDIMGNTGKILIIKRGEYGLVMFSYSKKFSLSVFNLPGFPLEKVVDPTGAGDSFAGGFMGYLAKSNNLSWDNLKQACVAGTIIASFSVESLGTKSLETLKLNQIQKRLKNFKTITNL